LYFCIRRFERLRLTTYQLTKKKGDGSLVMTAKVA